MLTLNELAESYEVDSIPEYVYDSFINGQNKQVSKLIREVDTLADYTVDNLLTDLFNWYLEEPQEQLSFIIHYFNLVPIGE